MRARTPSAARFPYRFQITTILTSFLEHAASQKSLKSNEQDNQEETTMHVRHQHGHLRSVERKAGSLVGNFSGARLINPIIEYVVTV